MTTILLNLTAVPGSDESSIELTWNTPIENGGSEITKYEIQQTFLSSCPEGALRVKPGLNSLKNALIKAKENGFTEIFLEDGARLIN